MKKRLVIALDGPSGSGKSTLARRLAPALGYVYIDSGAMYRAIGLQALRKGVPLDDEEKLTELAEHTRLQFSGDPLSPRIAMDGEDVSEAIRTPEATEASWCAPHRAWEPKPLIEVLSEPVNRPPLKPRPDTSRTSSCSLRTISRCASTTTC